MAASVTLGVWCKVVALDVGVGWGTVPRWYTPQPAPPNASRIRLPLLLAVLGMTGAMAFPIEVLAALLSSEVLAAFHCLRLGPPSVSTRTSSNCHYTLFGKKICRPSDHTHGTYIALPQRR